MNDLRSMLARVALVITSVPGLGNVAEAEVWVMDTSDGRQGRELEHRLTRQLRRYLHADARSEALPEGTLYLNLQVDTGGRTHVVNAHGSSIELTQAVTEALEGMRVGKG